MSHAFNFLGGEELSQIGATWFVSYAYHEFMTFEHMNWKKVKTFPSRIEKFNNSKKYHLYWLFKVCDMDTEKLKTNKIELAPDKTKAMAKELLEKLLLEQVNG